MVHSGIGTQYDCQFVLARKSRNHKNCIGGGWHSGLPRDTCERIGFIFYGSMEWAILPKEVRGGRLGISIYTYLCFRYKHSLPGSPGWRFGYKTDEATEEEIINYPQIQSQCPYCLLLNSISEWYL